MCPLHVGNTAKMGGDWQGLTWAVGPGLALTLCLICRYSLVHVPSAAAFQPGGGS